MEFWNHYIAGVEDIWCVMLLCIFLLVLVTRWALRQVRWNRLRSIHHEQSGATYMLPLVLTIPFYVLLIAMIIECTLMLTAKIGSVGAAYSAARSAAVWLPYETAMPKEAPDYTPLEQRQAMVHLAAARAMWAYASGAKSHASRNPLDEKLATTFEQQIAAFLAYSDEQNFDVEYLKRKFAYAYNAATLEIVYLNPMSGEPYGETETPSFNARIQLTLRYEAPIHTFGIGRLFGEKSRFGNYFVRPINTTVSIENEGVKMLHIPRKIRDFEHSMSLGIAYYTDFKKQAFTARKIIAFKDAKPDKKKPFIMFNNIAIPVYRVPNGSVDIKGKKINAARYSFGAIYLSEDADFVHVANELQHARDDARDGELNGVLHNSLDGSLNGPGKGVELTYLQAEIRSDQASVEAIEKLDLYESAANFRYKLDEYRARIEYFERIEPLIQNDDFEGAKEEAVPDFMKDSEYLKTAIEKREEITASTLYQQSKARS